MAKTFFRTYKTQLMVMMALALGMMALPDLALAGTGGTEFSDIYTLISGWAQGTLGKVISVGVFLVGVTAGIVQQSLMSAAVGIGAALVMYFGPGVIENILTAVV